MPAPRRAPGPRPWRYAPAAGRVGSGRGWLTWPTVARPAAPLSWPDRTRDRSGRRRSQELFHSRLCGGSCNRRTHGGRSSRHLSVARGVLLIHAVPLDHREHGSQCVSGCPQTCGASERFGQPARVLAGAVLMMVLERGAPASSSKRRLPLGTTSLTCSWNRVAVAVGACGWLERPKTFSGICGRAAAEMSAIRV